MATLKLNNTTVFTETNGAASIPSAVKFPAGHVVQVKIIPSNAYVTNATTSWITIDTIFIDNVSSSNKIVIEAAISHLIEGSGQGAYRIIRASDSVELCHSQHGTSGNGTWRMILPTLYGEDISPSTGTNTYYLQMKSSSSSMTVYYNYWSTTFEGTYSFFKLTEVVL
jgi:hypothetical protein